MGMLEHWDEECEYSPGKSFQKECRLQCQDVVILRKNGVPFPAHVEVLR